MTACNEYGRLSRVLIRPARVAFDRERATEQWRALNFTAAPDPARAAAQHDVLIECVAASGAQIEALEDDDPELTLDSVYVRDASVLSPRGAILCRMGKAPRAHEPDAQRRWFEAHGLPVIGRIEPPGVLEGGDVVWFDDRTVAVGRGYRTNDAGIAQLGELLGPAVDVIAVPLPHYRGPDDVFHLMSIISPVDERLAVVYSPLMPVQFREWLRARDMEFVEVPDEEFEAMAANVLAIAPRRCVMAEGAPVTRARLESAGVEVVTYDGSDISLKGGGGPTCLTRPLSRG